MEITEKQMVMGFITFGVAFLAFCVYAVYVSATSQIDFKEKCEFLDGVYVTNARQYDKHGSVSYLCLKRDVVIKIK